MGEPTNVAERQVFITETLLKEYETLRRYGDTNMFDYRNVIRYAERYGLKELAALDIHQYGELLSYLGREK